MKALDVSQSLPERIEFLVLRVLLSFSGELRGVDIAVRFRVKPSAVSRELSLCREIGPKSLDYDAAVAVTGQQMLSSRYMSPY